MGLIMKNQNLFKLDPSFGITLFDVEELCELLNGDFIDLPEKVDWSNDHCHLVLQVSLEEVLPEDYLEFMNLIIEMQPSYSDWNVGNDNQTCIMFYWDK